MRLIDSRTGIEVIDRHECLELLATGEVGRLALVDSGHPVILPVNYTLDGERIVFKTAAGTKLDVSTRGGPVAFEVDDADRGTRRAWSVVVTGWARVVTDPAVIERVEALGLNPWSEHEKTHWVAVHPERISGRRIVPLGD